MFSILPILSIALVAASSASGLIIPRHRAISLPAREVSQPPTYAAGYLEAYATYNTRYLAIGCDKKHNTTFFEACCHPLLANQTLKADRPAECAPTAAQLSSASAALPTSTVVPESDVSDDCEEPSTSTTKTTHTAKATSAPKDVAADPPKTTKTTHTTEATSAPKNVATDPPKTTTKTTAKAEATPEEHSSTSTTTHSSSASKATSGSSSSSSGLSGDVQSGGVATFFTQNGVAGACGQVHSDSDFIAAIDQSRYGDSGAVSPLCGKKVNIVNTNNQKSVTVTIADDCPTCENANSIDLAEGPFKQIATEAEGEVPIAWTFVD